MIHDEAERVAAEHVAWLDRRHEGYGHVWQALALAGHTTVTALRVAHQSLANALAAAWLTLPDSERAPSPAPAATPDARPR